MTRIVGESARRGGDDDGGDDEPILSFSHVLVLSSCCFKLQGTTPNLLVE